MHEAALMQSLFDMIENVASEYKFTKITRIVLHIGELTNVSLDALNFAFGAISSGSLAEDAEFVIEKIPARACCLHCHYEFAAPAMMPCCPQCGQTAQLIAGRELHLQTLEGDQEDE